MKKTRILARIMKEVVQVLAENSPLLAMPHKHLGTLLTLSPLRILSTLTPCL